MRASQTLLLGDLTNLIQHKDKTLGKVILLQTKLRVT